MPAITVLLRACPDGKEKAYSYGGTAADNGGRARPTIALPTAVKVSDPAVAITIRMAGVGLRHRQTIAKVTTVAMMLMPMNPPRWVNQVTSSAVSGVRQAMA
jgi:hypothetical protein